MMLRLPVPRWQAALIVAALLLSGCASVALDTASNLPRASPVFSSNFDSGSIGATLPLDDTGLAWQVQLRDDNGDDSLPARYRSWWYFGVAGLPPGQPLSLNMTRLGWRFPMTPVYSYDQRHWQRFADDELDWQGCNLLPLASCQLRIHKVFAADKVWIARFYPYTVADLDEFLQEQAASPYLHVATLGPSPHYASPIRLLTIAGAADGLPKKIIWIHARTHPGETGPSFVLEGLIARLLADDEQGRALRAQYVFKIVPMHNVDGVIAGNYRTDSNSINLEPNWRFDPNAPQAGLNEDAPPEDRLLATAILPLLSGDQPIALALNLHASNGDQEAKAFFIPHFGDDADRYTPAQQALWHKQLAFIAAANAHYEGRIAAPPADGGSAFLQRFYPETWWWALRQDAVLAMTMETTYGRAGFDHWVEPDDLRALGAALAATIADVKP